MQSIMRMASGKWPGILLTLGVPEQFLNGKHQPCLICGGRDRARFTDYQGNGDSYCNQCGHRSGADLLMELNGWDFRQTVKQIETIIGECKQVEKTDKPNPKIRLKAIAEQAQKLSANDPVMWYLKNRGLEVVPPTLRFHPAMAYYDDGKKLGTFPAMLALVTGADGLALTYHITYLTEDGHKADVPKPKKIVPPLRPIRGGAVRLFPMNGAIGSIGIAEGIETALAAHELYSLPVWSVLSTSGMKSFELPDGVREVTIFADNDANYAGQEAAYALAHRLALAEIDVEVRVPSVPATDCLDRLNARRAA